MLPLLTLLVAAPQVTLAPHEAERRVDIVVDGKPFTSYIWPQTLAKPVLWPLRTAGGTAITRGFPPGPKEDHPHHVGFWFNYGEVDGIDYWGNSEDLRKKEPGRKLGTIVHKAIRSAKGDALAVASDWVRPDGQVALKEETR